LLPQVKDGQERVTAYYSKMTNKAERNYCIAIWEPHAIVRTLEHFHKYLCRQELHLRTDHSALTWLMSSKNLEGQTSAGFSTYKSTTSLPSIVKAENTTMPMPFPDDHVEKSATNSKGWQTSSKYELLRL
jgi:hypothetical protein